MFFNYDNLGIKLIGAEKWRNLSRLPGDDFNTLSIYVIDDAQTNDIHEADVIFVLLDNVDCLKNISYKDKSILVFQDEATIKNFIESIKLMWSMGNMQIVDCCWTDISTLFRSNEKNIKVISEYSDVTQNQFSDIFIVLINHGIHCIDNLNSFGEDTNCIFSLIATENISFKDKKYFGCSI